MNDAFRVRGVQGIRDLDGQREQQLSVQRATRDPVLQGYAIEVLHCDECLTILLANVVDRADVGMVERGSSLSLPLEAAQGLWVAGYLIRQKLQSDETVQPSVLSLVDHTHPATTQLLHNAIMRDGLADQ